MNKTILVIDDDPINRKLIVKILEKNLSIQLKSTMD